MLKFITLQKEGWNNKTLFHRKILIVFDDNIDLIDY